MHNPHGEKISSAVYIPSRYFTVAPFAGTARKKDAKLTHFIYIEKSKQEKRHQEC